MIERLSGGAWSQAFGFALDGRELVVRFGRHRDDYERDAFAATLAGAALPIPEILEIGEAFGAYFAISPRSHGVPLDDLDVASVREVMPSLLAMLDALRSADLATTAGYGPWDASGNAPHATPRAALLALPDDRPAARLAGWRARLDSIPEAASVFARGRAQLATLVDAVPNARHVVHSDLLARNVLVDHDTIAAVLDWGCAGTGDFVYDLAWLDFWSPWHPGLEAADVIAAARQHWSATACEVADLDARLRVAHLHIGLTNAAYNAWTDRADDVIATLGRLEALGALA